MIRINQETADAIIIALRKKTLISKKGILNFKEMDLWLNALISEDECGCDKIKCEEEHHEI